jgi:hypothetical protein
MEDKTISEQFNQYFRKWRRKIKNEIFLWYGGKCRCCGESLLDCLTLDHINDDGAREIRNTGLQSRLRFARMSGLSLESRCGWHLYQKLRKAGYEKRPLDLQVLCWNCQWGKRLNNGFCPHHSEVDLKKGI